jgi:iron complex transport system ATP-binding protein
MGFTDTLGLADQPLDTMSGGERQRVLFAKALAQDTPLLLLDEPSASLDLRYQDQIFRYAQVLATQGKAIVAAIHDLRLAARYCTRVLLLARGTVVAQGTPEAVLTPRHLHAAYGVRVRVYPNAVTGHLDFHLAEPDAPGHRPHVHVIGGGGSAASVFRVVGNGAYRVTAGVLSPGDTDLQVASACEIPAVTCPALAPIPDQAFDENAALAAEADITVLCNLAVGELNVRNLLAAAKARRLVVLDDDPFPDRDFTSGNGLRLYQDLVRTATVLKSGQLEGWLIETSLANPVGKLSQDNGRGRERGRGENSRAKSANTAKGAQS